MSDFYEVIQDSLHDSIRSVLDIIGYTEDKVVITFANENTLEPSKTYCIIDILDMPQEGRTNEASFIEPTSDILETITHYTLKTQISFIGDSSRSVSSSFRHNIVNNRKCFEELFKQNFGMLRRSGLRRNPQKRETEWVDSFNMDLDLSFAIFTRQSFDWIEYITINGEVIRIWTQE